LRAVDERQPFLRLEPNGLEPGACERLATREQLVAHPGAAFADQREREMCERREVPARPDRPSARNFWQDVLLETVDEQLDHLDPGPGIPLRERVRAHQHRGAHDVPRVRLADPARMTPQEPELKLLGQLAGDARRHEAAEPRRDAVRRLVLGERVLDDLTRSSQLLACGVVQLDGGLVDRHTPDVVGGEVLPSQADRGRPSHRGASLARGRGGRTRP
jgi:hypothetical protein